MEKKEFDNILKENGLTRKDFAKLSGIQYTTIGRWNDNDRKIPAWVKSWLENYIDKKRFENMKDIFKGSGACDE